MLFCRSPYYVEVRTMRGMSIETTPLKPIYLEMGAAVQDSQRL